MNNIILWIFSIISFLMALLSVATSIIASLIFLVAAIYLFPLFRSRYLEGKLGAFLLQSKASIVITLTLFIFGFVQINAAQSQNSVEKLVNRYQQNPAEFVAEIKKNMAEKKFYLARPDVDKLLEKLPNDEQLKSLRHELLVDELKLNAAEDKLYRFDVKDLENYKRVMGASARTEDVQRLYEKLVSEKVKKSLANEKTAEASVLIDTLRKISPDSKTVTELSDRVVAVEKTIKAREEAAEQARKEDEAKSRAAAAAAASTSSGGGGSSTAGLSRVVSKVGSLIYLANGKTFAIERPTMLHIDGTLYPKGSGDPDLIQIGYRCRFIGEEFAVIEVFCER